ncbi:MAG TPA: helix-turn-helix domain-containing protein [Candidatus Limnocylindrales bacterium]|nr:helix-turn-helix domain-containing protein [Candidatus Limnocylindrales bacterium]
MDVIRLGLQLRALRIRRRWRQIDVAVRAGVSRSVVAAVERGEIGRMQLDTVLAVGRVLDARMDLVVRWHGEGLDRLLDAAHARLVDATVRVLRVTGWEVRVEVSFAIRGERGSIDVLAFHVATGRLLVIEVKSVVPDVQALLHGLDRKARVAVQIAAGLGWAARGPVGRLVVLPENATARRRIAGVAATFESALPDRNVAVRRWIRRPAGPCAGILFLSDDAPGDVRGKTTGVSRVHHARAAQELRQMTPGAESHQVARANVAGDVV